MDPTGTVTREQAATIIGRLYKADPGNVSPSSLDFKDGAKISSWSAGYIRAAVDSPLLIWIYTWMFGKLTNRSTFADFHPEEKENENK